MFDFLFKDIKRTIEKAHSLESEGKDNKALNLLEREAKNNRDYTLYIELGRLQAKLNQGSKAYKNISNAHMLSPNEIINTIERSEDGYYQGNYPPEVGLAIGLLYIENNDIDKASDFIKQIPKNLIKNEIKKKNANLKSFIQEGKKSKKTSLLSQLIAVLTYYIDKDSSYNLLVNLIIEYPEIDQFVIDFFKWITKNNYQEYKPNIYLGSIYLNNKKENECIATFERAISVEKTATTNVMEEIEKHKNLSIFMFDYLFKLYTSNSFEDKALELIKKSNLSHEHEDKYYRLILKNDKENISVRKSYIENLIKDKNFSEVYESIDFFLEKNLFLDWVLEKIEIIINNKPNIRSLIAGIEICLKKNNNKTFIKYISLFYNKFHSSIDKIETYLIKYINNNIKDIDALELLGKVFFDKNNIDNTFFIIDYILLYGNKKWLTSLYNLCLYCSEKSVLNSALQINLYLSSVLLDKPSKDKTLNNIIKNYKSSIDILIAKTGIIQEIYIKEKFSLLDNLIKLEKYTKNKELFYYVIILSSIKEKQVNSALQFLNKFENEFPKKKDIFNYLFTNISTAFPKNKEVLKSEIIILLKNEMIEKALLKLKDLTEYNEEDNWTINVFKKLKETYPKKHSVIFSFFDFLLKRKLHTKLITEIDSTIKSVPKKEISYLLLLKGKALIEINKIDEGITSIFLSFETSSQYSKEAVKTLENIKSVYDNPKLLYYIALGYSTLQNYKKTGEYLYQLINYKSVKIDRIIKEFLNQLKKAPTDGHLRFYFGKVLLINKSFNESIEELYLAFNYNRTFSEDILIELEKISKNFRNINLDKYLVTISDTCNKTDIFYNSVNNYLSLEKDEKKIDFFIKKNIFSFDKPIKKIIYSELMLNQKKLKQSKELFNQIIIDDNFMKKNVFELIKIDELLNKILKEDKENFTLWFILGNINLNFNKFKLAINAFQNSLNINTKYKNEILAKIKNLKNIESIYLQFEIYLKDKNYEKCNLIITNNISLFSKEKINLIVTNLESIIFDKKNFSLLEILINIYIKQNENNKIILTVKKLNNYLISKNQKIKILNISFDYILQKDKKGAKIVLSILNKILPFHDFFIWTEEKRQELYKNIDNKKPLIKSKYYREYNNPDKALEILENMNSAECLYEKCLSYIDLGNYCTSLLIIKNNLSLFDNKWRIRFLKLRLRIYYNMGDYSAALGSYTSLFPLLDDKERKIYKNLKNQIFNTNPAIIKKKISNSSKIAKNEKDINNSNETESEFLDFIESIEN